MTLLDLPPAPIPDPVPAPDSADHVSARYCKTLQEAGKKKYDVVIVGGGAVGAAVAHRLMKSPSKPHVLVLEKGPFLLPEHVQNLHPQYQGLMASAVAKPWRLAESDGYDLAPQIPFLGGRALFWSTWIPRPTRAQMPTWPKAVLDGLDSYWKPAEEFLGSVVPAHMGPSFSDFQDKLLDRLMAKLKGIKHFIAPKEKNDLIVPLASRDTRSELKYRKFSPVAHLLRDANDPQHAGRMDVVTSCEVVEIEHGTASGASRTTPSHATALVTSQGKLTLGGARLVLANGVVEPTGLLLKSFPEVLPKTAGTNLGGHVASWFSVRVPRKDWPKMGTSLQVGCTYLRGRVTAEHLQHVEHTEHVKHVGHTEHVGHTGHTEHVEHTGHAEHVEHAKDTEDTKVTEAATEATGATDARGTTDTTDATEEQGTKDAAGTGDDHRDFHIHLMGASNPMPDAAVEDLYRLIPDSFDQDFLTELSSPEHIGFLVHCLGEWRSTPGDTEGSTVRYENGHTVLSIKPGARDTELRTRMDAAALEMACKVLADGTDHPRIEYWKPGRPGRPGTWQDSPPDERIKKVLVHESGTLWMGENATTSITDLYGRLHTVDNVYVAGAATFPTSGSWNPTLTAVALGQRLADHLAELKEKSA